MRILSLITPLPVLAKQIQQAMNLLTPGLTYGPEASGLMRLRRRGKTAGSYLHRQLKLRAEKNKKRKINK